MTSYIDAKKWSDKFIWEMRKIIGPLLLEVASPEEDMHHATDLVVLTMRSTPVACRVRSAQFFNKYAGEFTIRSKTRTGRKTELTKILEGWGEWFFYGYSNPEETGFQTYTIIDLKVFRLWFLRYLAANNGVLPGTEISNLDGSAFRAFKISDLPPEAIVAKFGGKVV